MMIGILIALIVVVLILVGWVVMIYNSMVAMRRRVDDAWSDIDVQLKRRYDLIPNLVETVKGYAKHEESVFEKVTQARTQAMSAGGDSAKMAEAENMLSGTLKSLFAVAESYPELKANQNFVALQQDLTDTEDKIQSARRFYNGTVRDYNTLIEQFPGALFAGLFGFKARDFFEIADVAQRENVKVSF